jgi:transposase-like protein
VLLSVMLGMRESHEDWLALARDLIARGLGAPLLVVADGAPGLIKAVGSAGPPRIASTARFIACATCWRSCPTESASAPAKPIGRRSTRRPTNATQSKGSRPWSTSSTEPATPLRRGAWPTTSTH